ncbi:hypothetical protein D2917_32515 (plasmid) [Cupriavidus oxalaticus]|uniref:Uncharacterized protein n=2 Tax=Cupriavidus oxalaticus TaxID=96344 RepID=A0A5P3VRV7_9BURK|nr:hypothetical protein D2917_32515 [Cupriavidus oxalaticus]
MAATLAATCKKRRTHVMARTEHAESCRAHDSQHSGQSTMKAIRILTTVTLAALSASALAGPNWDVINSARLAAQPQRVASAGDAAEQAMCDHCAQMMGQMPAGAIDMHGQMMHRSAGQSSRAAALFGERATAPAGTRSVTITPGMKAVPVSAGETVRFDFGSTSAAWAFAMRPGNAAVELSTLFPEIPAAKGVWADLSGTNFYSGH